MRTPRLASPLRLTTALLLGVTLSMAALATAPGVARPPAQGAASAAALTERAALERLAQASTVEAAWFAPSALAVQPLAEIQQLMNHVRQVLGAYQAVLPVPNAWRMVGVGMLHSYYVTYQRGLFRAFVHLDPQGRFNQFYPSGPKLSTDRVLVGGYHMYFRCLGKGTPTVLLEAGSGSDASVWEKVMPAVARSTRVCAYDRTGLGGSDARPGPRTSAVIVQELHALLTQEGVPGPYLLVGHSFAGLPIRLFASRYAREVVGMVMVDASHPDALARMLEALGPKRPGEPASLTTARETLADSGNPMNNAEHIDLRISEAQVRATGALGSIPLVVLTAGTPPYPLRAVEAVWRGMHEELAGLSADSVHVLIPKSGHVIQLEDPQPVIAAVSEVIMAVRTHQRLPSCPKTFPALGGVCFPAL